jgi:hypothetical protein
VFFAILERLEGIEGRERKRAGPKGDPLGRAFGAQRPGARVARLCFALARQGAREIPSTRPFADFNSKTSFIEVF